MTHKMNYLNSLFLLPFLLKSHKVLYKTLKFLSKEQQLVVVKRHIPQHQNKNKNEMSIHIAKILLKKFL